MRNGTEYKFICDVITDVRLLYSTPNLNPVRNDLMELIDLIQDFANKMEGVIISKNELLTKEGYIKCPNCRKWVKPIHDEMGDYCIYCSENIR